MLSLVSSSRFGIVLSVLLGVTQSHVIPLIDNITNHSGLQRRQGDKNPTHFNWVKSFAAIGDSYSAGIGSGAHLGQIWHNRDDWRCSRYDQSYPMIMNNYLGTDVEKFQYLACSGDKSWQIYDQAKKLEGNIDLLTLTAGGNDLCLAEIIKDCIMLSFYGEATCNAILKKAQGNLDLIMRHNIKEILLALNDKMADDGIVVFNSYARFFNTENEDCAQKQDWSSFEWVRSIWLNLQRPLPLTVARRKRFNELTTGLNDVIHDVIKEVQSEVKYNIGFSNWDRWAIEGVKGQMCDPSSSGAYPDPDQPDLIFFKPDTRKSEFTVFPFSSTIKRNINETVDSNDSGRQNPSRFNEKQIGALGGRLNLPPRDLDEDGVNRAIYKSSLWNSVNPRAAALKRLDPRAPDLPGCPGNDNGPLPGLGDFVPDFFGRVFHPNEEGHNAIASFAIETTMNLRAKVLGVEPKICEVKEQFKCWQKEGMKGYATADVLDMNYKKFCDEVKPPGEGAVGWKFTKKYQVGTPDEQEFEYELGDLGDGFNKNECLESFKRIIHGCDGNDPENPLNWKFGGTWKRDQDTYTVTPKRTNRPWPLKKPYGSCEGESFISFSGYVIAGAGWSSWDEGRESLLPAIKSCLGKGVTTWTFKYLDKPDDDGYEWYVGFHTPVFVNNRCFKNNKAVFGAKGFTDGCKGSGWA
ncbi:predicted protein [Uncinocarpus reesii 1704]|uniref:Uncharacterized protein n=1 Tax=Uncinocarpus reesii (strain UAMH 1704) TaxID=336963 RepID=C4JYD4_UNCRE|nr:uncharacterized protein UREG_07185 [Uncinocarpus reesii 1704]EEP82320.1 predicted protein [Uncinocarpus reesii 1704]